MTYAWITLTKIIADTWLTWSLYYVSIFIIKRINFRFLKIATCAGSLVTSSGNSDFLAEYSSQAPELGQFEHETDGHLIQSNSAKQPTSLLDRVYGTIEQVRNASLIVCW